MGLALKSKSGPPVVTVTTARAEKQKNQDAEKNPENSSNSSVQSQDSPGTLTNTTSILPKTASSLELIDRLEQGQREWKQCDKQKRACESRTDDLRARISHLAVQYWS